jgi:hypothetical protein
MQSCAGYVATLLALAASTVPAQAANITDDRIVYTLIGNSRRPIECRRPYTLAIYPTGRVTFEGRVCDCEIGIRILSIPERTARKWFDDLSNAGWLELTRLRSPEDATLHELQLHKDGRSNTLSFSYSSPGLPPRVREIVRELHRIIAPNQFCAAERDYSSSRSTEALRPVVAPDINYQ